MNKVHFLHIPKTAGQSVHQLLVDAFGINNVCPLRVNSQINPKNITDIKKYDVVSGHFDWDILTNQSAANFTFTVLRKPIDRILSYYHFLHQEALKISKNDLLKPENTGAKAILDLSPDLYFCGGSIEFQKFIDDHYDNFYTCYFYGKKYNTRRSLASITESHLNKALSNLSSIDEIYTLENWHKLKEDLATHFPDLKISSKSYHLNKGNSLSTEQRFEKLREIGPCERAIRRIHEMCEYDDILYKCILSKLSGKRTCS